MSCVGCEEKYRIISRMHDEVRDQQLKIKELEREKNRLEGLVNDAQVEILKYSKAKVNLMIILRDL